VCTHLIHNLVNALCPATQLLKVLPLLALVLDRHIDADALEREVRAANFFLCGKDSLDLRAERPRHARSGRVHRPIKEGSHLALVVVLVAYRR